MPLGPLTEKFTPEIIAILMSMALAVVRVIYDRDETRPLRIFLEAIICGLLTMTAGSAVQAMGLSSDWTLFAGGLIGFLGSAVVRSIAVSAIQNRAIKK